MKIAIRLFIDGVATFEERYDLGKGEIDQDRMSRIAADHATTMLLIGKPGHTEIEFLDEPDISKRFFRLGTDPRSMVTPIPLTPRQRGTLQEADAQRKRGEYTPRNMLMASDKPIPANQIIQYLGHNWIVAEELTREEFLRRHQQNIDRDGGNSGITHLDGSQVEIDNAEPATEPPPDAQHYYAMKRRR